MESTPAPAPVPAGPTIAAPDAARAEIAGLVAGTDSAFAKAYADPSNAGHAAARARMDALHAAAYGDSGAVPVANSKPEAQAPAGNSGTEGQGDVDASAYRSLTLETLGPDVAPAEAVRLAGDVQQVCAVLALPPELARGAVGIIERDIAARDGRPMDQAELMGFEAALRRQAGDQYEQVCDALASAIERAGPRGELLRRAIVSASPGVAAWAVASLARSSQGAIPK